jgi:hypothetical protein
MNPIKRKMAAFLTEAACSQINSLDNEFSTSKQLSEIEDVEAAIAEGIETICQAATFAEIRRVLFLAAKLRKASGPKRDSTKNDIKKIAEVIVKRVETESGPLKLPQPFHLILLGI